MTRITVEWDSSWDDDWEAALRTIDEQTEEERPRRPEQAVQLYRYGFSAARRHPLREWPDVENELYQDYMSGTREPREYEEEWEEAREWARRGWRSARP